MDNKNLIIILSVIVVILSICVAMMFIGSNGNDNEVITYENYTVNATGTTVEIPVNSKIEEKDNFINITNDELVYVLIFKNTTESKTAVMTANSDIMDEKLNKDTQELVQVISYDDEARKHVMNSIKFGKPVKTDEKTAVVSKEVDHSKDPVYCSICGAYVATQYEIDHAPGAGYFIDPSTGKTICDNCASKLMEEESAADDNYEFGEQEDGSYIDADGNYWESYDEYLYYYNSQ